MLRFDDQIIAAQKDEGKIESLIRKYEPFILSSAAHVTGRHVTKSDDEWSIALLAFYESVQSFKPDKGRFTAYAKMSIRSRLIDYFRAQKKSSNQVSLELVQEDQLAAEQEDFSVQYEIQALEQAVNAYGFSYLDLVESSPKAQKTKSSCKAVIRFLLSSPVLIADMQQSKMLPIKIIEKKSGVPRKIIERHRKYIVTAVEILSGDYPHLAEYFAYIKEEDEK